MSEENVESYRRVVDAWNRGNFDDLLALMDDDVEVVPRMSAIEGESGYRGHDGLRRWWSGLVPYRCDSCGWRGWRAWNWDVVNQHESSRGYDEE